MERGGTVQPRPQAGVPRNLLSRREFLPCPTAHAHKTFGFTFTFFVKCCLSLYSRDLYDQPAAPSESSVLPHSKGRTDTVGKKSQQNTGSSAVSIQQICIEEKVTAACVCDIQTSASSIYSSEFQIPNHPSHIPRRLPPNTQTHSEPSNYLQLKVGGRQLGSDPTPDDQMQRTLGGGGEDAENRVEERQRTECLM